MTPDDLPLAYAAQVITHLTVIPNAIISYTYGRFGLLSIGLATVFTSFFYHICDVMATQAYYAQRLPHHSRIRLLGLTAGQWHRLDNIFTILSFQYLILRIMRIKSARVFNFWQMILFSISIFCQEVGPWKIEFTIIPIIIPATALFIQWVFGSFAPTVPSAAENQGKKRTSTYVAFASICLIPAIYCFVKGLDDENDWIRIHHSLWHVFLNLTVSFVLLALGRTQTNDAQLADKKHQ